MPRKRETEMDDQPIGIVISRGRRVELPPRFSAYVWAAVAEDDEPEPAEAGAA